MPFFYIIIALGGLLLLAFSCIMSIMHFHPELIDHIDLSDIILITIIACQTMMLLYSSLKKKPQMPHKN